MTDEGATQVEKRGRGTRGKPNGVSVEAASPAKKARIAPKKTPAPKLDKSSTDEGAAPVKRGRGRPKGSVKAKRGKPAAIKKAASPAQKKVAAAPASSGDDNAESEENSE